MSPESDSFVGFGPTYKSRAPRTLYRALGLPELSQVLDSDARAFPTGSQLVFALGYEHAEQLAPPHAAETASGFAGFVADLDVDATYLRRFEVQLVGEAAKHREIWVPPSLVREFNAQLRSPIRLRAAFYDRRYLGPTPLPGALEGAAATAQLETLSELLRYSVFEFASEVEANWKLVLANVGYWSATAASEQGLDPADVSRTLQAIAKVWQQKLADRPLPTGTLIGG